MEPPAKEGAYREQLSAAHARIAALEERLAARTGGSGVLDRKVRELEDRRGLAEKAAHPDNIRKIAILMAALPAFVFSIPAVILAATLHHVEVGDWIVFPIIGLGLGGLLGGLARMLMPRTTRLELKKVEQELDEAIRLRELEREVGATRRLLEQSASPGDGVGLRVEAEPAEESVEDGELPEGGRSTARRV